MPSSRWARPTIRRLPGSTTLPARPSGATPGFCLSMVLARSWSSSTREAARSISLWTSTVTSSRRSSMKTARVTLSAYLASALISLVMPAGEASAAPSRFISVTPCRQYDSRNSTPLPQNTSRAVLLTGAPCGVPTSAVAVSVNITVFNISGATGNGVFLVGPATDPTSAWINFPPTEVQRSNAGVLPLDDGDQIWVRVQMGSGQLDLTVDVNGYYDGSGALQLSQSRRAILDQFWTPQNDTVLGSTTVGSEPLLVRSDGADLWVANINSNSVSRVRASDGKLLETWTGATGAYGVLVAMGSVFVTGQASPGQLYRIDPSQAAGAVTTVASN